MRVLAVTPNYPPHPVGAWLATHDFLRHLAGEGHDVAAIAALTNRSDLYDEVQLHRKQELGPLILEWADVVVSHAGDNGKAHRYAIRNSVPSVRLVHGALPDPGVLEGAALVVFNSHASADLADHPGRSIVAHPPTDPDVYRTTPGDMVTLINLSKPKGVMTMWKAAERLPGVEFLGVRGGYGQQHTPRSANVETIPSTTDMRGDVYARTRILLMPSEAETWGRTGIEAMCSGIPVIAHPTPGLLESLGAAGVFVDRDDIDGWVREITRLQDPDEWAAASAKALERVAQLDHRADLSRFAEAIESLVGVPA